VQKVIKSCYRICDILYLATKTNQIREVTFYEEEIIKLTSGNGYGCYDACRMWIQWGTAGIHTGNRKQNRNICRSENR
jgi:hypothetical protein